MPRQRVTEDKQDQSTGSTRTARITSVLVAVLTLAFCAVRSFAAEDDVRLRIAWGGKQSRGWTGQIALDLGNLTDVAVLGMEADAPGSVWLDHGRIHVDSITPHLFDGVDVTVPDDRDARLQIELRPQDGGESTVLNVSVAEVATGAAHKVLDAAGNQLLALRAPGDHLRITTDRENLIFGPGETASFTLTAAMDDLEEGTSVDVTAALVEATTGRVVWTRDERLAVPVNGWPSARMEMPLPASEGVYTLRLRAKRPPGFSSRFVPLGQAKALAARDVQLVVFDPTQRPAASRPTWHTVLEIDPANPEWWQRLPSWTQVQRLPGFPLGPLGTGRLETIAHPLGALASLPPTTTPGEPHWQAFPLPVEGEGRPHILEVEYPVGTEQYFGLSIVEANAAGKVEPIGRDWGVYVEGNAAESAPEIATHRAVFWPRTNNPLLLVVNRHPTAAAQFGHIRVYTCSGGIAGVAPSGNGQSSERLIAAYLSRPLFAEAFGAAERLDPNSGQRSVDGWQTFFDGATRLADYLQFGGFNAAVVNIAADGSSIFPSRIMTPTPRHDSSLMADGAIDLPKKDVVGLMLQAFDRRGLRLIPAIQLAAPLPNLERLRRNADADVEGIELVGRDGRTWLETRRPDRGLAPYYNPLHPRVQEEILGLVDELVGRYGSHPAFAGLAVQLDGRGYSQLPGLEWGFDDATIASFERDTGIDVPGDGPERFAARAEYLLGEQREAWQEWRAHVISVLYGKIAEKLQNANPDHRLLLTTEMTFSNPATANRLRPHVLEKTKLGEQLVELGIDAERLAQIPGVTLCLAQQMGPPAPLVDRAVDLETNGAVRTEQPQLNLPTSRTAFFFHRPQRLRLSSFDEKSPYGAANTFMSLVEQPGPGGPAARRRFVEALAANDPWVMVDGGELLPIGQEESTRRLFHVLQQLPAAGTSEPAIIQQPIVIRTYQGDDKIHYCVVNCCPWQTEVNLTLDVPQETTLDTLGDAVDTPPRRVFNAGKHVLTLSIEPYDVWAGRFSSPELKIAGVQVAVDPQGEKELQQRLQNLTDRDLTQPSAYPVLRNPGFEPAEDAPGIDGWELSDAAVQAAQIDQLYPVEGVGCLKLTNRQGEIAVQSPLFKTPPTGQLGMSVYVRAEDTTPETQLRIVFEATTLNESYRKFTVLDGNAEGVQPLSDAWGYYAFGREDLPLDSQGVMRVRFEMVGPGRVWIDGVQLYDLLFPFEHYRHAAQEKLALVKLIYAAQKAYEGGRITDCVRLLNSYWPRFVTEYTPLVAKPAQPPAIVHDGQPAQPVDSQESPEEDSESPSLGERLRPYLPGFLR